MSKAEEIYEKHIGLNQEMGYQPIGKGEIIKAMQEYALACLEKAAENAKPTLLPCGIFADLAPKASITSKDNLI